MVIKTKVSNDDTIAALEALRAVPGLSHQQRAWIEEEISNVCAGERGEREAGYFIDFELGSSRNYAILHDLRIEHEGRVAQIDHLIIGRMADIILIESKNISTALRTNKAGEFEVKTRFGWKGMSSPVEQNRRHAKVLGDFLKASGLLPRRFGSELQPEFHQWVLVPAQCSLEGNRDLGQIAKMDMFGARMKEWIDRSSSREMWKLAKLISPESLREFAAALAKQHRPISFDYAGKFGINSRWQSSAGDREMSSRPVLGRTLLEMTANAAAKGEGGECATCGIAIHNQVTTFCRRHAQRFGGNLYCRTCQVSVVSCCDQCATPVDSKTAAFCRFNSRRFAKRVLCRSCQTTKTVAKVEV